jgi:ribonuclease Z
VPAGPERRDLVSGRSITLADGSVIHPGDVLGPTSRGTKLVHIGDCARTDKTVPAPTTCTRRLRTRMRW